MSTVTITTTAATAATATTKRPIEAITDPDKQPVQKKQRKRRLPKVVDAYNTYQKSLTETPSLFEIKKAIRNYTLTNLKIPTDTRKVLKKIRNKEYKLDNEEELKNIVGLYETVVRMNAMEYMINSMFYYKLHHNFVFKTQRDLKMVNSNRNNPMLKRFDAIHTIYKSFVGNIEELNGYYYRWLRSSPLKAKGELTGGQQLTATTKKTKKRKKVYPYTLFIKQMWSDRPDELSNMGKEVMSKLAAEWRGNPELQQEYKQKASLMNEQHAKLEEEGTSSDSVAVSSES